MIPVANHLWQSTFFAAVAGLLTLALRKNRAAVRYWIWFAASVKFLIPFSLLIGIGSQLEWRSAPVVAQPRIAQTIYEFSQPFAMPAASSPLRAASSSSYLSEILFAVWLCGVMLGLIYWARLLRRVRAVERDATILNLNLPIPVMSSLTRLEPGVFGIFKPILILPAGIAERLTPAQLEAVLAHELCHVRRKDNLTAAIHMLVEIIFWFHPLVWWIRTRLVAEREQACDEAVLMRGSEPRVYAEGLLNVCRLYVESPLTCVAGVTGSDLRQRIRSILTNPIARRLSAGRKILLAGAGLAAACGPIVLGVMNAPQMRAQTQAADTRPVFEAATVKPNSGDDRHWVHFPPGRMDVAGQPLRTLIMIAYDVRFNQITGVPAWADESQTWDITARADDKATFPQVKLMFQKLLEERFRLSLHRETRQAQVYNLQAARGGLKLTPSRSGDCVAVARDSVPPPAHPGEAPQIYCGNYGSGMERGRIEVIGTHMSQFAFVLSNLLGRQVIDKTGFAGAFDIHLAFTPDQVIAAPNVGGNTGQPTDPAVSPSIFTALQEQMGLRLESSTGLAEMMVIDHVEKPSGN